MKLSHLLTYLTLGPVAMLVPTSSGAATVGLDVGDRFPELVLPALTDGEPMSISSFRGRKLVLHVWASW